MNIWIGRCESRQEYQSFRKSLVFGKDEKASFSYDLEGRVWGFAVQSGPNYPAFDICSLSQVNRLKKVVGELSFYRDIFNDFDNFNNYDDDDDDDDDDLEFAIWWSRLECLGKKKGVGIIDLEESVKDLKKYTTTNTTVIYETTANGCFISSSKKDDEIMVTIVIHENRIGNNGNSHILVISAIP